MSQCRLQLWTLFLIVHNAFCLRLLEFKVDKHSIVGNNTRLQCEYDLQGEQLYTVKWYKDDNEFYRFLPGESPEVQMFNITGVYVDQKHSAAESIVLRALELESSGQYRCEVTVDAPSFQTVTNCSVLTVAMPGGSHILEVDLSPTPTSSASSTESLNINMIIYLCTIMHLLM